jgi:DNA modification methylase
MIRKGKAMSKIELINGDCLVELKNLSDNSVDLVLIDPPYNIGKDKWDKWNTVDLYVEFLKNVFIELQRLLKDNGSFYFFHNDFMQIVEIQNMINKDTDLIFKNIITLNKKGNYIKDLHGSKNHFRKFLNNVEYCLFYTFEDETGLKNISNNQELYKIIRDYFKEERNKIKEYSLTKLNELIFNDKSKKDGMAGNIFSSYKKGWTFPTRERYEKINNFNKNICSRPYKELRQEYEELRQEYEELRQEYEGQRYTFNFSEGVVNSLTYDFKKPKKIKHPTVKPNDLMEDLIKCSSNEGDTVLDCFMGSGSTGVAAKNLNRNFIGIELDEEYFNISKRRINNE